MTDMSNLVDSINNQETLSKSSKQSNSGKGKLNLVTLINVPIFYGGKHRGASMGPAAMRVAGLKEKIESLGFQVVNQVDIDVPDSTCWRPEKTKESKCVPEIEAISADLARVSEVALEAGTIPITVGGDHSFAIGSISGVSNYYRNHNKNFGLVWFDAHGDINTPETSTTGAVHGMPLAIVLGRGDKRLVNIGGFSPKVTGKRSALIGIRDLDPPEYELIDELGVTAYSMRDIDQMGMARVIESALNSIGVVDGIHLSFDIDVLDPEIAPGVTTRAPGGVNYREAKLALTMLAESRLIKSMDFAELNPARDNQNKTAELAVELITTGLAPRE